MLCVHKFIAKLPKRAIRILNSAKLKKNVNEIAKLYGKSEPGEEDAKSTSNRKNGKKKTEHGN